MNAGSFGTMGTKTTRVSSREELLNDPVASGPGVTDGTPDHTPQRATQMFIDTDASGGIEIYIWVKGLWISLKTFLGL